MEQRGGLLLLLAAAAPLCLGEAFSGWAVSIQQRQGASAGDRMHHGHTAELSGVPLFTLI